MRHRGQRIRKRLACLLGAGVLLTGGMTAGLVLSASPAGAQCSPTVPAPSCTITGTLDLTGGALGIEAPATLSCAATLNGLDQEVADTTDTAYTTVDPTGTGAGWTVTAAATTFTATSSTLPDSGTLVTNGSTTSEADTTPPGSACASGSTCTAPVLTGVTFPVAITTAATGPTPTAIYDADTGSGEGSNVISPAAWWVNILSDATPGTYTSTITLAITSGPVGS
jgi:hypothetical protein